MSRVLTRNARTVSAQQRFAQRTRARRWRTAAWVAALVALIAAAGAGAWAVGWSSLFEVRDVDVRGTSRLSVEEVLEAAQVPRGVPLIHTDTADVAGRVESLRLVADADVSRRWPHTIRIDVTERTTAAVVAEGADTYALLDASGVRFDTVDERPEGIPLIDAEIEDGAGAHSDTVLAGLTVARALPPELAARTEEIRASTPDSVTVLLDDGVVVEWGGPQESAHKAAVLAVLMQQPARVYDVSTPEVPTTSG
jgi:cell division protein FtsQ